jgi:hypothetical protein
MDFHSLDFEVTEPKQEFYFGLFSDLHLEATDHDSNQFKHDMEEAVSLNSRIFINGDIVDAIVLNDTKRYSAGKAPYPDSEAQINKTIDNVVDKLIPYVNNIDLISPGNHEESLLKYNNFDILSMIIYLLNKERDSSLPPIIYGDYRGIIRLKFKIAKSNSRRVYDIYRHHGIGGAAPISKGMIDLSRLKISALADLYWIGHKHKAITDYVDPLIYANSVGQLKTRERRAIITPGYKKAFSENNKGRVKKNHMRDYSDSFYTNQATGYGLLRIKVVKSNVVELYPKFIV